MCVLDRSIKNSIKALNTENKGSVSDHLHTLQVGFQEALGFSLMLGHFLRH